MGDAVRRASKGGIEDFLQTVRRLSREVVGQRHRVVDQAVVDRQVERGDAGRQGLGVRVHAVASPGAETARHLGEHQDHRQPELVQRPDEVGLGRLEAAVAGPHAVPGDVQLIGQRLASHPVQVVAQLGDQRRVVTPDLEPPGVEDPERAALVQVEVLGPGDRLTDPGLRDLRSEDRVDERALADAGLAEDGQVEPTDLLGLVLPGLPEGLAEPLVGGLRHDCSKQPRRNDRAVAGPSAGFASVFPTSRLHLLGQPGRLLDPPVRGVHVGVGPQRPRLRDLPPVSPTLAGHLAHHGMLAASDTAPAGWRPAYPRSGGGSRPPGTTPSSGSRARSRTLIGLIDSNGPQHGRLRRLLEVRRQRPSATSATALRGPISWN